LSPHITSIAHNLTFENDGKVNGNRGSFGASSKSAQNHSKDFSLVAEKKPLMKYDLPFGGPSAVKLEDKKMQLSKIEKTPNRSRKQAAAQQPRDIS
jgi:hypothetical protein